MVTSQDLLVVTDGLRLMGALAGIICIADYLRFKTAGINQLALTPDLEANMRAFLGIGLTALGLTLFFSTRVDELSQGTVTYHVVLLIGWLGLSIAGSIKAIYRERGYREIKFALVSIFIAGVIAGAVDRLA